MKPFSHCHYCGADTTTATYVADGLQCGHCKNIMWMNPSPVAVLIAPCHMHESGKRNGVFVCRRGIEPFKGQLALPGGFIVHTPEIQETWQQAATREAYEEIQIICRYDSPVEEPKHILTESSYNDVRIGDRVLIIGASDSVFYVEEFVPTEETLERVVLFPDDDEQLCFPIHRKALAMYWDQRGVEHNVQV